MANAPTDPSNASSPLPQAPGPHGAGGSPAGRLAFLGQKPIAADLAQILADLAESTAGFWELPVFSNQKSVLRSLRQQPPHLVLVEVAPRPGSRVRFAEMIRYRLPGVPIYAVGEEAPTEPSPFDGFLRLPVTPAEFIQVLDGLRHRLSGHVLQAGPIRLDVATRTVITPNGQHHMTPKQCALLQMLMDHPDKVVSRSAIMRAIWETSYMEDTRTLDVHIRWLRECIEPDPSNPVYLITVRGQGYHLRLT